MPTSTDLKSRRFGSIDRLPSGAVRARWRDAEGKPRSKSFRGPTAVKDAERHLAGVETDLRRGVYVDERKGKTTFGEFAEHYFATRTHARTTRARDMTWYRVHIAPTWHAIPLDRIRPEGIDAWIATLKRTHVGDETSKPLLAPATVWDIFVVFRKILLAAVTRGFLQRSPIPADVHKILPKKKRQKTMRFLTEAEVNALARTIGEPWDLLVYLGAYGGLRLGELAALRVEDFDFLRGTVYVDEAATDVEGIIDYADPKSDTSVRKVSLPDEVMEMAREHIESRIGWDNQSAFVFTTKNGRPFRASNWRNRVWNPAVEVADLAPLTPHDLRHTAASFWIADGADLVQVAERLGHAQLATVRIYAHLLPERDEALRARQSERFKRGADGSKVVTLRPKIGRRGATG